MEIDRRNVKTFRDAMGELRKVRQNLQDLGVSYRDAVDIVFDAYELGCSRTNEVWRGTAQP